MQKPPDILVVLTSQWRGQALGFAGDPNARTPELDAMARDGVAFTRALTPHPFGPFARAAFLTGIPSPDNGVADYYDPLPRTAPTLARVLAALGYETAFIGKWHLAPKDRNVPLVGEQHARQTVAVEDRGGFEHWEGFEGGFQLNDPWLQGDAGEPSQVRGYQSDVLVDRAIAWFARPSEQPRLCVLSLEPPHPPYAAPAAGVEPRDPASVILPTNVPRCGDGEHRARTELAGYYAHIEATDRALGRLLRQPVLANAVSIVTSVHGDMHGAHGLFRKGWPYEESLRVPLIVRLPKTARPGARAKVDAPVTLLDLRRWIIEWARGLSGFAMPAPVRCSMPSVVALPHQCDRAWRAVIEGPWKYVEAEGGIPWLLFNLADDPLEQVNRIDDPAAAPRLRELRAKLG